MDYANDYASRVESYICQNDGILGPDLTADMRQTLEGERPLTLEDSKRWIDSIDFHLEAKLRTDLKDDKETISFILNN